MMVEALLSTFTLNLTYPVLSMTLYLRELASKINISNYYQIGVVDSYQPPNTNRDDFFNRLEKKLPQFDNLANLIIIGDFNFDMVDATESKKLADYSLTNGYSYVIKKRIEVSKALNELDQDSSNIAPDMLELKLLFSRNLQKSYLLNLMTYELTHYIKVSKKLENWKISYLTSVYKGKGSKSELENYRPISIIYPVAKIFEKLITENISDYFELEKLSNLLNMDLGVFIL